MALVRYWAAAREAAGVAEERLAADTLAEALSAAEAAHGERFARLAAVCSYLVDGEPAGRREPAEVTLREDSVVEVLPPFAGG
ncbi:MAG: MoaD/ThiS family protein [Frankiaceae bacterium]